MASAGTPIGYFSRHVACAESQQRHTFDTERGDDDFAHFAIGHRTIVVADDFDDDDVEVEDWDDDEEA